MSPHVIHGIFFCKNDPKKNWILGFMYCTKFMPELCSNTKRYISAKIISISMIQTKSII